MPVLRCKMCGGTMEIDAKQSVAVCQYCGTRQTLPRLDSERVAGLYERAELLRRGNDFDKAAAVYEQIVSLAPNDAEAYWSLVLCRYGIEYVEDPASHKRVPTINRVRFGSILEDADYLSALRNADDEQKSVYIAEAEAIEAIQKGYLAISEREKPFDVFICYKETDDNGKRTMDSVLANDLYHQLTQEGFKVFFSRITLEDKLGTEYEPYIFAALNSAKVMVVLGTRPEYFSAVWVRNEWSRFLALIKNGEQKVLIPAYRDMNPYDLPEEFSHLQALDMSRLGFMQDLIRGIKKILGAEAVAGAANTTSPLLRRASLFLENREWKNAESYCERILDQEPENAQAYVCKLMAELQVSDRADLRKHAAALPKNNTYRLALRYADGALKAELESYAQQQEDKSQQKQDTSQAASTIRTWINRIRRNPLPLFLIAAVLCIALIVYLTAYVAPSKKLNRAMALIDAGEYDTAYPMLESLGKDELIADNRYQRAVALAEAGDFSEAMKIQGELEGDSNITQAQMDHLSTLLKNGRELAAADTPEESVPGWKAAYRRTLANTAAEYSDHRGICTYALYDIEEDGTPELFLKAGASEEDCCFMLYTAVEDEPISLATFPAAHLSVCGISEKGFFLLHGESMGDEWIQRCTVFNGELSAETVFGAYGKDRHALTHLDVYEIDDDTGLNWTANQAEDNQNVLDNYVDDYLIPCSSTDYLTDKNLQWLSWEECTLARNEIYARHGRIFKTAEIAAYFKSKDWYAGTIPSNVFDANEAGYLSDVEYANTRFILDYEKAKFGGSYY